MKKHVLAALFVAAALIITSSCSKTEDEHEESKLPEESYVVLEPVADSSSESSSEESSSQSEASLPSEESSSEESYSASEASSEAESNPKPEEPEKKEYSALILVNPWNYIPEDYEPELENVQGKYNLDIKAAASAKKLLAAAKEAGFDMALCSAYRTVEKSAELYQRKVNQFINAGYSEADAKVEAAKWVAPPGTSEHHTGLAMDLVSTDYWGYYSDLEHDYEKFDSFKWMYEHCAEFGFILRYPKDKQEITGITYEPWHYRYVGVEAASYIMENGLCLEEYLELTEK